MKLVYFEEFIEKRDAQKREYVIKHLTRNNKLNLIKDFNLLNLERS